MLKNALLAVALVAGVATVADAGSHLAQGEVTKINEAQGKITVRHGPIPSLDMEDGMTMVFRVNDQAMLEQVRPGDRINFDVERLNGALTITVLEKRG
jgi:Cu(I)/Ag(I) efflux system periplasmic protein CusF